MSLVRPEAETELFIGLVGAVGSDLGGVVAELKSVFRGLEYDVQEIRMSALLRDIPFLKKRLSAHANWAEHQRITKHMDAGNTLRAKIEDGGALAAAALNYVRAFRGNDVLHRRVFIFNSLKHPGEVSLLRVTYGERFFLISAYEHGAARQRTLSKAIRKSYVKNPAGSGPETQEAADELALKLMTRDEQDPDGEYGQSVRKAFPMADVFVRLGKSGEEIRRFVHLLFGAPNITPSKSEIAMMTARATALRSADLSRQVGAVIALPKDGSIIAMGCNEVPKPGGDAYWEGDSPDRRDFAEGGDQSALMKREIQKEILSQLRARKWLNDAVANEKPDKLVHQAEVLLEGARVSSLLEFGRIVHAEMAALMDAARRGVSVQGATLVCTTFPCHMCARHIIAAGIVRVIYIEPYPKSMAQRLYPGSIETEGSSADSLAVVFEAFGGVSPNRFDGLFSMPPRKDKQGYALKWEATRDRRPKIRLGRQTYLETETAICNDFNEKLNGSPVS